MTLDGRRITGLAPHRVAALGVGRTFQALRLFKDLTCLDNVLIASHRFAVRSLAAIVMGLGSVHRSERRLREEAARLLDRVGLAGYEGRFAANLSYGQMKRLELARTLAGRPRLLLLDEPLAGLNDTGAADMLGLARRPLAGARDHVAASGTQRQSAALSGRSSDCHGRWFGDLQWLDRGRARVRGRPGRLSRRRAMRLRISGLVAGYGVVEVLRGVDLEVEPGTIVTVIGHNGAGKTTLLRAISGLLPVRSGSVYLDDREVTNVRTDQLVRLGLVHCPVGRRCFMRSTVAYNLSIGAFTRRDRQAVNRDLEETYERFPLLWKIRHEKAGTLSGGQQQLVALARALMSHPQVLLLDEPSMGLAPRAAQEVFSHITKLRDDGLTVLMAEQSVRRSLSISNRASVIEGGKVILNDTSQALLGSKKIQEAFLGAASTSSPSGALDSSAGT